jgi:hypothetical protein
VQNVRCPLSAKRMDPKLNDTRGPTTKTTGLAVAAIATMGIAAVPFAAKGKDDQPEQYISQSDTYGTSVMSTTQSHTYGTSGTSMGTVTASSVGSYYWPSVARRRGLDLALGSILNRADRQFSSGLDGSDVGRNTYQAGGQH